MKESVDPRDVCDVFDLVGFVDAVLDDVTGSEYPNEPGCLTEGVYQELAVEYGLLVKVQVDAPCADNDTDCSCLGSVGWTSGDFPKTCYRRSAAMAEACARTR